jgi:hypothetical protein
VLAERGHAHSACVSPLTSEVDGCELQNPPVEPPLFQRGEWGLKVMRDGAWHAALEHPWVLAAEPGDCVCLGVTVSRNGICCVIVVRVRARACMHPYVRDGGYAPPLPHSAPPLYTDATPF